MRVARWPIVMGLTLLLAACASGGGGEPSADVHPWLLDPSREHATDALPADYPYEVAVDGGTVIYDRGPTPGGFAWLVAYRYEDGSAEVLELDELGEVGQRTSGMFGAGHAPPDGSP